MSRSFWNKIIYLAIPYTYSDYQSKINLYYISVTFQIRKEKMNALIN